MWYHILASTSLTLFWEANLLGTLVTVVWKWAQIWLLVFKQLPVICGSLLCYTTTLQQSGFIYLRRFESDYVTGLFANLAEKIWTRAYKMIVFLHNWNLFIIIWLDFLIHRKHFKWNSAMFTTWHFRSSRSLIWSRIWGGQPMPKNNKASMQKQFAKHIQPLLSRNRLPANITLSLYWGDRCSTQFKIVNPYYFLRDSFYEIGPRAQFHRLSCKAQKFA